MHKSTTLLVLHGHKLKSLTPTVKEIQGILE